MNSQALQHSVSTTVNTFGQEMTEIAAMVYTTRRLINAAAAQHGFNPAGMLATLDKCVESRLIDRDLHPLNLRLALSELALPAREPEMA